MGGLPHGALPPPSREGEAARGGGEGRFGAPQGPAPALHSAPTIREVVATASGPSRPPPASAVRCHGKVLGVFRDVFVEVPRLGNWIGKKTRSSAVTRGSCARESVKT